jgi:LytS/YehU family sensor histidine kinase
LYFNLLVIYGDWPWRIAIGVALVSVGVATVLGIGVWWLTGRLRWPSTWSVGFFIAHVLLAIGYSVAWLTIDIPLTHAFLADIVFQRKIASMHWEMLFGLWVYGLIAGASYAVRARREADLERRAAERAMAIAAQAQLAALRSQLNPHFLFNVLHTLGTLARHDVRRHDEALELLGDLLRRTLDPASSGQVEFEDDLAFALNYLELERLRLGDRLRVEVDVSAGALEARVPFLTLQPLAENAVLHGIGDTPGGGTLRIAASVVNDVLEVVVSDDADGDRDAHRGNGIGLGALRERLALTYDRFELNAGAHGTGGYRVRMALPLS